MVLSFGLFSTERLPNRARRLLKRLATGVSFISASQPTAKDSGARLTHQVHIAPHFALEGTEDQLGRGLLSLPKSLCLYRLQ
ncbi:hypothetical protein A1Q2_00241 [Trichosporon asahii var. asahii CBS 8904]|uniref:Uncharacterized protein n=1 Tax=Trichosporon asahii var. asahii (strain CBS 8904) TaxID=1220162 RepID=K1VMP8_TRIAC|nr:hypothetical protein A1Q2_00241 [Trichosporon asahii var. asahii CBS 8904]